MVMDKNLEKYKGYYDARFWNKEMLINIIGKKITEDEFNQIVNDKDIFFGKESKEI